MIQMIQMIQTIYSLKDKDTRTSKTMFPSVGHANTQIQLHKYTNTVLVKFVDRHYMCYIFEKVIEGNAPKVIKNYHIKGSQSYKRLTSFSMENAESALFTLSS